MLRGALALLLVVSLGEAAPPQQGGIATGYVRLDCFGFLEAVGAGAPAKWALEVHFERMLPLHGWQVFDDADAGQGPKFERHRVYEPLGFGNIAWGDASLTANGVAVATAAC
jgi:hypothetical protein